MLRSVQELTMEKTHPSKNLMVVDRLEEGYAILIPQDTPEEIITIPIRYLRGIIEGDIIELSFRKDETATREAVDRITIMRERLISS